MKFDSASAIETFLKPSNTQASKRIDCNKALLMSDGDCSAMEILISRHLGNFYYNYNRHYDMMNSVTRSGSTLGNGIETSSSITVGFNII